MMSWMSWSRPDLSDIKVPDWVRFIAQDADGSWWGYSVEPLQNHRGWYENELGEHVKLKQAAPSDSWPQRLYRYPFSDTK
jgi:hypothetical protein